MRIKKYILGKIFLTFLIINTSNCEKLADSFFSEKDDVKMGLSFDKEIRSNSGKYTVLQDKILLNYVQKIVNTLKKSPKIKRKSVYPYKVTILDDDKVINAFCTPGGFIYVYTGLMKFLENEASLAAVLAHEIAHAEKRHARQRMLSRIGINILLSLLLGSNDNPWIELGMKLGGGLAVLHNSRGDEKEADEEAFKYLENSPYYRGGMSYFFDKVSDG
ncbi:MAG: M48 family metalloprotease [Leptospiraceae bacterium]|nr:M48 family metalloprotease [Leptospiraceae bacterium]